MMSMLDAKPGHHRPTSSWVHDTRGWLIIIENGSHDTLWWCHLHRKQVTAIPLIFFKVRINMVGFKGSEQVGWQTYGTQTKFPAFGAAAGGAILCTFHQNMSTIRNILNAGSEYQTPCRMIKTLSKLYTILTYMILYCTCKCPFTRQKPSMWQVRQKGSRPGTWWLRVLSEVRAFDPLEQMPIGCGSKKTTLKKPILVF